MKYFLSFAVACLFSLTGNAAGPTPLSGIIFTNLDRSEFIINFTGPNTNIVKINAQGVLQGLTTTNYFLVGGSGVSVTTTTLGTNVTFTLDSTSLNSLWTNVFEFGQHDYYPSQAEDQLQATNIVALASMNVDGVFRIGPTGFTNLVAGPNNVDLTGIGFLQVISSDSTAQLRLGGGPGPTSFLLVSFLGDPSATFTLKNGDAVWDTPSLFVQLRGGDWTPTLSGETMLLFANGEGWTELERFGGSTNVLTSDLWRFAGGYLQPKDLTQPLFWTNSVNLGTGSALYRNGNFLVITNSQTAAVNGIKIVDGNGNFLEMGMSATPGQAIFEASDGTTVSLANNNFVPNPDGTVSLGGSGVSSWWNNLGLRGTAYISGFDNHAGSYSRLAINHTGTNGAAVFDSQGAGSAGLGRPYNFDIGGTNFWSMTLPASTQPLFTVQNNTAKTASLGINTGGEATVVAGGGAGALTLYNGTHAVKLFAQYLLPGTDDDVSLSGPAASSWWHDLAMRGTAYISGFDSGAGDYQRLAIHSTGTNGAIVFDSQAAGSAGPPRAMQWNFGGTNTLTLSTMGSTGFTWDLFSPHRLGEGYFAVSDTQGSSALILADAVSGQFIARPGDTGGNDNLAPLELDVAPRATSAILNVKNGTTNIFQVRAEGPIVLPYGITKAQKTAITSPVNGMIVYQTDNTPGFRGYQNGAWVIISTAADP